MPILGCDPHPSNSNPHAARPPKIDRPRRRNRRRGERRLLRRSETLQLKQRSHHTDTSLDQHPGGKKQRRKEEREEPAVEIVREQKRRKKAREGARGQSRPSRRELRRNQCNENNWWHEEHRRTLRPDPNRSVDHIRR